MRKSAERGRWRAFATGLAACASLLASAAAAQPSARRDLPLAYEDRAAIEQLIFSYSHFVDARLPEAWASTFAPDGRFEFSDPRGGGRVNVLQGRAQLADFVREARARGVHFSTHFVGDTLMVQTAPGRVHARSAVIVAMRQDQPGAKDELQGVGVYDDEIIKTDEGWKFKSRRAGPIGTIPVHADFLPTEAAAPKE